MSGGLILLRVGSIGYINSLPVDLGIATDRIMLNADIVQGVPSDLNEKMLCGALDISPISSFFYAQHQDKFLLLSDVSISSESGVRSVLLFSRCAPRELAGRTIAVSGEGRTTPVLLEILCRKFYGFAPITQTMTGKLASAPAGYFDAILLIGDEALTERKQLVEQGYQVTDLAEEWRRLTGLGFVFAVWAVRRGFFMENETEVREACRAILESKAWGLSHRIEVIAEAKRRIRLTEDELEDYFSSLSYDLSEPLLKGMSLYFQYAREYGFLPETRPVECVKPGKPLDDE